MKNIEQYLEPSQRQDVIEMLGQKWRCIGGMGMPQPNLAWGAVSISTDEAELDFTVSMAAQDFENDRNEYPRLEVHSGSGDLQSAIDAGSAYFQGRGQVITAIWLLRDTIAGTERSIRRFEFSLDVGVVFELETECVAITLASYVSDGVGVVRAETRKDLNLPHMEDFWHGDLSVQYDYSREWILLTGETSKP